jgi:hypothetical protein
MSASSGVITIQHRGLPRAWAYAMLAIVLATALAVGVFSWTRSGGSTVAPSTNEIPSGPASSQVVEDNAPPGSPAQAHFRQIGP